MDVNYTANRVVWVELGNPDRKPFKVTDSDCEIISKFQKWMLDEKIYPFVTTISGGGIWRGAFDEVDWPDVLTWLNRNGIKQGSTRRK